MQKGRVCHSDINHNDDANYQVLSSQKSPIILIGHWNETFSLEYYCNTKGLPMPVVPWRHTRQGVAIRQGYIPNNTYIWFIKHNQYGSCCGQECPLRVVSDP